MQILRAGYEEIWDASFDLGRSRVKGTSTDEAVSHNQIVALFFLTVKFSAPKFEVCVLLASQSWGLYCLAEDLVDSIDPYMEYVLHAGC